jgi:hypothetical protein
MANNNWCIIFPNGGIEMNLDTLYLIDQKDGLGSLGREKIKENTIDYYLEQLADVRNSTIATFKTLPEEWLFEQTPFWWDRPADNYFKWFHVYEDELSHRGQIRLIKKMVRKLKG